MALTKTRKLMTDLATALKLPGLPQDENGAFELSIGDDTSVQIFGGDDESLLVVVPVGAFPKDPGYAQMIYLLRMNMFDAETSPFQVGADEGGTLVLWGRLSVAAYDGASFAKLVAALSDVVDDLRTEVLGEGSDD